MSGRAVVNPVRPRPMDPEPEPQDYVRLGILFKSGRVMSLPVQAFKVQTDNGKLTGLEIQNLEPVEGEEYEGFAYVNLDEVLVITSGKDA